MLGDLAVVRLIWMLGVMLPGAATANESKEPGLDVFPQAARWQVEDRSIHCVRGTVAAGIRLFCCGEV